MMMIMLAGSRRWHRAAAATAALGWPRGCGSGSGSGAARSGLRRALSGDAGEQQRRYAEKNITPVTIQQMLTLTKHRLQMAPLLQEEIMVRVAKRHREMLQLPQGLLSKAPIQRVLGMYSDFFAALASLAPPKTDEADKVFTETLRKFYKEDGATLPSIALGMRAWKEEQPLRNDPVLNAQLDDLFTARLSVRMLIGQHCQVPGQFKIKRGLRVSETAAEAAENAKRMCIERFGTCPEIQIKGNLDCKITYVHSHLHHMIFELLKNSVRAVVEQHEGSAGAERRKRLTLSSRHLGENGLPPVLLVISGGKEDVVLKVSDEGGGIPRSDIHRIWSYEYTTAASEEVRQVRQGSEEDSFITFRENFYGMGYGLPIARVFARYFGGDLKVISTEGWGTDAYIYLNRLESASLEALPE